MGAEAIACRLLRYSPAQLVFRWVNRDRLAVIAYHSVSNAAAFDLQMRHLRSHHNLVSLKQVTDAIYGRSNLPRRPVLITFDDGDRTIVENALPILGKYGIPGVLFAVAGSIDSPDAHWWIEAADLVRRGGRVGAWPESDPSSVVLRMKREPDAQRLSHLEELRQTASGDPGATLPNLSSIELRGLDGQGIDVENHTLTHPSLDQCDRSTVEREILEAHQYLSALLGRAPTAFAYPGGYYSEPARTALASLSYRTAFLFDHRLNRLPLADPLRISRLRLDADAPIDRLAIIVSGLHPALLSLLGRVPDA